MKAIAAGLTASMLCAGAAHAQSETGGAPNLNLLPVPFVETERLADNAVAAEQARLAFVYLNGSDGHAKDLKLACKYAKAASLKRPEAMHLLGDCHQFGWGGEQNMTKAEKAYGRARSMGYVDADAPSR
jgi:TPR repeat protein